MNDRPRALHWPVPRKVTVPWTVLGLVKVPLTFTFADAVKVIVSLPDGDTPPDG